MAYVNPDYKTKKEFITAVNSGIQHRTFNPPDMFPTTQNGSDAVEGPHYPKPHKWYAQVTVQNGIVTKAK